MAASKGPLLAVDLPSMLYRAFFALPDSIKGSDGKPVNALLGAANLILQAVEEHVPRAVVLCLGPDAATYRVELYPGYHAERPEMPEGLVGQWADAPAFFEAFGWTVADHDSLEADDLLGSFAELETKAGGTTLVMTGDRDMFQCASDSVTVLYVSTGKEAAEITPAEVQRRYGIPPELVPDFIALRGDPSDHIPGAKGVGPKGAASLLQKYETLEAALADPRLAGQEAALRLYQRIATMNAAAPLPPLEDQNPNWAAAAALARDWELNRLAERLAVLAKAS